MDQKHTNLYMRDLTFHDILYKQEYVHLNRILNHILHHDFQYNIFLVILLEFILYYMLHRPIQQLL
nr:MAG TPA: hypothetical protein [Caudoviricetes sp.]